MDTGVTLVFVHGKGGLEARSLWLAPLTAGLNAQGYPTLNGPHDAVRQADYLEALLAGAEGPRPEVQWVRPIGRQQRQDWADFLLRREALAEAIDHARNQPRGPNLSLLGGSLVPDAVAESMEAVASYRGSGEHRHAAWRAVLDDLPEQGGVIVIAHSLGSILMIDLLKRLPPLLTVDLLVTIGSPMGVKSLRAHHHGLDEPGQFPAAQVRAWVNVYDPGDAITVGRGASQFFPAALDVPVHTGGSHSLTAYMSHPVVAAAVGFAAFGRRPVAREDALPARRLDPRWDALLLRFAYTAQLWSTCDTGKWGFQRRLDTARRVLARRAVQNAANQYEDLVGRTTSLEGQANADAIADLEHSPVHPARMPTESDLLVHATDIVRNQFSDDQLVVASVDFLLSPPLPPFDLEIDPAHAQLALAELLQRVRRSTAVHSGTTVASEVAASVKEARAVLSESGFPWGPVLITAGIGLLAATGVGLVVAAPAGLVGAAAIASTLATFGPGGMVGGIATLTALTGAATAITGLGVVVELTPGDPMYEQVREAIAAQLAEQPAPQLRTSVAGMIAVLSAQRRLDLPSEATGVEDLLLKALAIVQHEGALHAEVAPGRPVTKDWQVKGRVLARALDWMAKHGDHLGLEVLDRATVRREIEQQAPE